MASKRNSPPDPPPPERPQPRSYPGLIVCGTEAGCGKTVVTTGLSSTLAEQGFATRAVKPICLGDRKSTDAELSFLATISRTPLTYPIQFIDKPGRLATAAWTQALRFLKDTGQTTIAEMPGSSATPLASSEAGWRDCADFGAELGWPCLVVARAGVDAVEKLLLNSAYLAARGVTLIGLVVVETASGNTLWQPTGMSPEAMAIALQERTGVPFLGCLEHSPSISVPRVNQGNLIKTTSSGLDLLPIIKALNFRISV